MNFSSAIDTALDRAIAPGYGNIGLFVRRHLADWPADPARMDGRVVLVTGAASGIGLAATRAFAELGAEVRALVRSDVRARELRGDIDRDLAPPAARRVRIVVGDVSSLASIRRFAGQFTADEERLDVLVNNAGVMPQQREVSDDGIELTFATHVLGPFVLTGLLADLLARNPPGRVINVTSGGMYSQRLAIDDLQSERVDYQPAKVYARTKRAQMILTEMQAQQLAGTGIFVHAMHPGWVDTRGVRQWLPRFRVLTAPIIRTPGQGADTITWLATAPEAVQSTGKLWQDRHRRPTHYTSRTRESEADRRRLWDTLTQMASSSSDPR